MKPILDWLAKHSTTIFLAAIPVLLFEALVGWALRSWPLALGALFGAFFSLTLLASLHKRKQQQPKQ